MTTPGRKRRKRNLREDTPPPMVLTERDKAIIETVYQYRVMRQDQIRALFFGASKSASQRRLALLFHHGFLARQFLTIRASYLLSPVLYLLDRRGAELLRAEQGYDDLEWQRQDNEVGQMFLEHALEINDVRVAVTLGCRQQGWQLPVWKGESELKADYDRVNVRDASGRNQLISLIPDSFFVIALPAGRAPFFLELDRGTETTKRFQSKILAYQAYVQSGAYTARYGFKSIRVLTVTQSAKRLESLKKVTEEAGGRDRYWFAVLSAINQDTIMGAPVWWVAGQTQPRLLLEL